MDKKFFETVFILSVAEPYAMGCGGIIEFVNEDGELLSLDYNSDETPYEAIKEAFPILKGCKWNGPMIGEEAESKEIVLYIPGSSVGLQTRVSEGWHHLYMGFGNHLVIREDMWSKFELAIADLDSQIDIYGTWRDRAINFAKENIAYEN